MPPYQLLEHTADIGIAARGASLEELFCAAGEGLLAVLCPSPASADERIKVSAAGNDREELLVAWLQEILYLIESRPFIPVGFSIESLTDTSLTGTVHGETFDPGRHRIEREVKAVTFHRLDVSRESDGWKAKVYLDL